jgi:hypothetical protein
MKRFNDVMFLELFPAASYIHSKKAWDAAANRAKKLSI